MARGLTTTATKSDNPFGPGVIRIMFETPVNEGPSALVPPAEPRADPRKIGVHLVCWAIQLSISVAARSSGIWVGGRFMRAAEMGVKLVEGLPPPPWPPLLAARWARAMQRRASTTMPA